LKIYDTLRVPASQRSDSFVFDIEHIGDSDGALALFLVLAVVVDEFSDFISLERRSAGVDGGKFSWVIAVAHVLFKRGFVVVVGEDTLEHEFLDRASSTRKLVVAVN
jgi:hypothetical protein